MFWSGAIALVCCGVLATAALAQTTQSSASDPAQVVEAYQRARGGGDVDAALAEFADSAIITLQGVNTISYAGSASLRAYMQNIGTRFQIVMRSRPTVVGSTVSWTERDQFSGQALDTTVVAVVRGDRIVSLTYRDGQMAASRSDLAGIAPRQQPIELPSAAWPAALAVLSAGLLGIAFGRPRRRVSVSQLDGRLLLELRREREQTLDKAA